MILVGLEHVKKELCKEYSDFSNKISKHSSIKREDHIINPYHKHQLLR
jgi:hypothetical protein